MATTKTKETKKVATKTPATKKVAKSEVKKSVPKKSEVKKVNKAKINLTMTDLEEMLNNAGIGFKHNNCEYRILKSNTAIHIQKSKIKVNCTQEDYDAIKALDSKDIELHKDGNACDKLRPQLAYLMTVEALKKVIKVIAPNNKAVATA